MFKGGKKGCSSDLKENKINRVKDRGSGCCALVAGSMGGAEIRVCRRQRKKREGRKKGRADSYFSTLATGLRGILTTRSDCRRVSVTHTRSGLKRSSLRESSAPSAAHHQPPHASAQVCSYPPGPSVFFSNWRRYPDTFSQRLDTSRAFPPSTCDSDDEQGNEERKRRSRTRQRGALKPLRGIVTLAAGHEGRDLRTLRWGGLTCECFCSQCVRVPVTSSGWE